MLAFCAAQRHRFSSLHCPHGTFFQEGEEIRWLNLSRDFFWTTWMARTACIFTDKH